MTVRYSPRGISRMNAYRRDIEQRLPNLTTEEKNLLISAAMTKETTGIEPRKVKCPECKTIRGIFNGAAIFCCECSPGVSRSVWDCRA